MASRRKDMTGVRYGRLIGREYLHTDKHEKAIWLFQCDCGVQKEINASDVRAGKIVSCGCKKKENILHGPERNPALPGYFQLHHKIKKVKGSARLQTCVDCGNKAAEWSYNRQAEVEHQEFVPNRGQLILLTYALDLDCYEPRCYKCHRKFDGLF